MRHCRAFPPSLGVGVFLPLSSSSDSSTRTLFSWAIQVAHTHAIKPGFNAHAALPLFEYVVSNKHLFAGTTVHRNAEDWKADVESAAAPVTSGAPTRTPRRAPAPNRTRAELNLDVRPVHRSTYSCPLTVPQFLYLMLNGYPLLARWGSDQLCVSPFSHSFLARALSLSPPPSFASSFSSLVCCADACASSMRLMRRGAEAGWRRKRNRATGRPSPVAGCRRPGR
jgi:hypothetical protein